MKHEGGATWQLWVDPTPRTGWLNMAIDHVLLDLAAAEGVAFLRLYRWHPWCLSFGRHEPAARRFGREQVSRAGLDAVRRPTGGRSVWHARELTYAVAAPLGTGTLQSWYGTIHATLLCAVRALGATEACLAPRPSRLRRPGEGAGGCFETPAGG
ncbi:MAG: hypothetical protein K6U88_12570 [Dehalococcoidia bacterium]|nr:hypothetical protein [Dehalococcoidia bacterium]